MPPSRSWFHPLTRRELTLLLFSLTVFVLSYNLETSLHLVGVHPEKSTYLSTIGLGGKDPGFDPDGRRPKEWRDDLENLIFGDWSWEEGKVAEVEHGAVGLGLGDAAIYNSGSRKASRSAGKEDQGIGVNKGVSVHEQFVRWGSDVPVTKVLAHVPGYTILDNVLIANGTIFLVTDDPSSLPSPAAIASSTVDHTQPPDHDWQVLSKEEAGIRLGAAGGRIYGTSWIATDLSASQDPYTLLSLFRAHSTLSSDLNGAVAAPLRLMFPYVPTFSSPQLPSPGGDEKIHPPPRERSYIGLHPSLPKVIMPMLGIWFQEDWQDLAEMNIPWLLERVVVADRGAAVRGRDAWNRRWRPSDRMAKIGDHDFKKRAEDDESKPAWAAPFVGLPAPEGWWAPVRTALLRYLRVPEPQSESSSGSGWRKKKAVPKPVVTYVSMQDEPFGAGPRLRDDHHEALVSGLAELQREGLASEVFVVRGNGSVDVHGWEWEERMKAIARSSVVLGPYGFQLADSIFMPPSAALPASSSSTVSSQQEVQDSGSILMEFFPPGTFVRDQEFAVRSLGLRYMAWWNDRKFIGNSLPPVMPPEESTFGTQRVPIEPNAILQAVREELSRR